ncbi:hypothetical protein [Inquilinus limosus]|uniref:Uncharacterized protein n=1 Tax=Inquilinus limosus MP06 TaxID=1398085 RepID=A0A0A0DE69_9PROT|nr:hypothetical protein [Inquilinus limosus]KGM36193.1 hypothetical protein P409_00685 [Inquilinus limosus MP06]
MAVSSGDIIRGVWGAWRLAKRDTGGMAMFDISPDGAAKSFVAAALAFPLFAVEQAVALGFRWPLLLQPVPLVITALGFLASWLVLPAALTWILPWLGRGQRLAGTIVACNWAALLISSAGFVALMLNTLGLFPGQLGFLVLIVTEIACFIYEGFVLRTALEVELPIVAGLVVFDALTSELLVAWITGAVQAAL